MALAHELRWRWKLARLAHHASRDEAHRHPGGYAASVRASLDLYRRHGFMPDEAARLGLLQDPAGVEQRYVSKSRLVARQRALNHPSFQELTEDKALFYVYCTKAGLPVPRMLGIFLRGAAGVHWGKGPLTSAGDWTRFLEQCPDEFVVKPSRGVYGQGIIFADRRDPAFSAADLYRRMSTHASYTSFIVQECLGNHPALNAVSPSRGLQTVRVITFVRADGTVDVLMAYLKPIGGDNRVDNHNSGRTGNLLCRVDLADGRLGPLCTLTEGGIRTMPAHPGSGAVIEGHLLPLWPEVRALAQELARQFLPMRAIGWDIAITTRGAVCIEGNARWDPPKFGDVTALRPVLQTEDR